MKKMQKKTSLFIPSRFVELMEYNVHLGQEQRCDPDPGLRVGAFLGGPGNCILMSGL